MMKRDQEMRNSGKYNSLIDKSNTASMKQIVRNYGWPGYQLVRKDGALAAWLLVQHADHDLVFQKKCLSLIENAVKRGQADKVSLAYLTDRVLVHEKKKQLYGTQFYLNKKGKYGPRPIKDLAKLDERRKVCGLEPFKKYEKTMQRAYRLYLKVK